MSQVSYGTITITDTNDIESITIEYARNQSTSNPPDSQTGGWSTTRPDWAQGYYIWQRARIHKSGTNASADTFGAAVCLTGSTGQTGGTGAAGRSLTGTTTQYTTAASNVTITQNNMGSYTWSNNVPAYNSSTPVYWVRVTNTYSNPSSTEYIFYKDQGITDAIKTSNDANTTANSANTKADNAVSTANLAKTKVDNLETTYNTFINTKAKYFVHNSSGSIVIASREGESSPVAFDENTVSTYGYNTLSAPSYIALRYNSTELAKLSTGALIFYKPNTTNKGMELTSTALTFYNPSTNSAQLVIGANGVLQSGNYVYTSGTYSDSGTKIDLINGSIYTPGFRTDGSNTYIRGEINALTGKIGNNSSNYWTIGNYYNYDQTASAALISHGTAFIQLDTSNTWRLSTDRIHTAWNGTDNSAALMFPKDGDTYWDWGVHSPHKTNNIWKDKFIYARKYTNTSDDDYTNRDNLSNDLDDDLGYWTYQFYVDRNGSIYARNFYLLNADGTPGSNIGGQDAVYLLKTGGTITGNLEVNGTLTKGNKNVAYLSATPTSGQILVADGTSGGIKTSGFTIAKSVPSTAIFTDENVKSVEANTTKLWLVGSDTSGTRTGTLKYDSGVYITATAGTLHATTFEGNLSGTASRATADGDGNTIKTTYLKLSGGNVTGAVTFGSSVSVDELTVGDLVVNGAASFTNNAQFNTINGVAVGSSPKFTDNNTTYTFTNGTNGFTVTPSGGTAQTVTVTPSITNNVTGSGTSGYLAKFTGGNTIGNGPALGTDTTKFLNNKGEWAVPTGTYTYTLPLAANGTRGGVQIGYSANGKNYPVQLSSEKMYVNVPWTDTTYTIATGDSNGQIKVTPSSGNAYNVSVKGLGSAAFVNTSLFPIVSTYSLPAAKAVRIQYPTYVPVLISAQRSNSGGRLILLGGGYGAEGTIRNDFQELISSNTDNFTWTLPSSTSISNSIEIMNLQTNGAATVTVWSSAAATFTEINALSNDAMNRVIVTSANYTNYTVTKTGSGASGNWGINVTGTAANVTGTVAIANGGTGKTTANDAINALLSGLPVWSADPLDTTYFIRQDTGGSAAYGKVPATTLWNYINGKLPSWSKASSKPSYSYSEIGSAPDAIIDATVNEQGVIVLTKNSGGTIPLSTEIAVVESQGANKLVTAGTTTGINVGSAAEPVYFSAGVPVKGNAIPKLNNATTGGTFYAPTAGGTADTQALVGNGATTAPKWVNISPSISITAGTGSATPKINVTVLGRSGTAQSLTTASTSVYGATKLSSTSSSTEQGLAATPKLVYDSIAALDGNLNNTTPGTGKTLTAFSQTDGKISATFGDISITKSQISDFPTSMTPTSHTHDDRYYTETEINNKFTALTNSTTEINKVKFYSGTFNAGKTYIGWIKIASFTMTTNNYIGENGYEFELYRGYNSPASESYNIRVNTGWGNASIVQLNGKAGTQIIEKFRLVRDNTNHICYFEIYVNPSYATYQNNANLRVQTYNGTDLTLLNTVQTEADSSFEIISTIDLKPQGVVSNSNFYGDLVGNASTASSVNWSGVASTPTTLSGYGITNAVEYLGNLNSAIGSGTPAAATKTYYENNIPSTACVKAAYNNSGTEYSLLFSRSSNWGSVLKWGYTDKYIRILRRSSSTWQSEDWEKISAGYADIADNAKLLGYQDIITTLEDLNNFKNSGTGIETTKINAIEGHSGTLGKNDGIVISIPWNAGYCHQIYVDDNTYAIHHRYYTTDSGTGVWADWVRIIDSSNYTSYTVTKTGEGASGTWGISISGTAAKATADASGNTITSTYVKKAGDTMTGCLVVQTTSSYASYNEGIRINKGSQGYSTLLLGGTSDATSGTNAGAWWIGVNNTNYPRRLMIAHNGSGATGTYFYTNADSTVTPNLRLGSSGTITSGNMDAVNGGTVYTAISNLSGTYVKTTGNEGILGTKVFGSGTSYGTVTNNTTFTQKANINYDSTLEAIVFSFA